MLHTRPELVLRRADELLSVGQPLAALSSISEVFSSRRFRMTPLSVLEPIMIKFLELCVDLRKGRTAKDGLILYKNVAQNTSVQSVEVTIQKLLDLSRAKLDDALHKVNELEGAPTSGDVEDLEATETPESILLSAVSEEKTRDRTYRTLVTPWLRFLWESYRTALEILRNNARLEVLYQTVCHEAFQFCLQHQRKTEFRRLCETLRSHLASSQKYTHQSHSINLNEPDTLQRHLDTRFQQLNTAVELELWQEAFRTAEDIHTLVGMSKRAPKASVMASFYDKMAKVFAVGQNFLFHAAAYSKLYSLHAARVALTGGADGTDAELDKMASRVLLAALAVPLGSGVESAKRVDGTDEGEGKGRLNRLASLIGLGAAPTRGGLLHDALARHVLKRVSPELRELYQILEVDFHPLSITRKIEPILAQLETNPDTARYVAPLKDVVLARLFQQLAQVYASLKIDRVVRLARFSAAEEAATTRLRVERYVTEACRRGDVDVTLDHASGSIKFTEDLFGDEASTASHAADALQPSASALLRTHLARLASTLHDTLEAVGHPAATTAGPAAARAAAFENLAAAVADERETALARVQIIQRRRELADEQSARREKEEAHARSVRQQQLAEEEQRRQKEELKKREIERIRKEVEKVKADEAKKVAESLIQGGLKVDMQKLPELSAGDLVQLQVQQIEKDKKSLAQKLATAYKRLDHLERAFRKEEIPLIAQDYERQQQRDREAFEAAQVQRAEQAQREHAQGLAIKASLQRILPDYQAFRERAEKESRAAFEREQARLRDQLEEAKAERRRQHLDKLEQERQAAAQREKDEAERRAREEEEARAREEEEAREAEERARIEERRRAADEAAKAEREARLAERRAEQEAILAKARAQAQREEEALARRSGGGGAAPAAAKAGPAPIGSAEWRRQREAAAAPPPGAAAAPSGERPRFQLQPRSSEAGAAPAGERPRLNLAPRSTPRPEAPPAAAAAPTAAPAAAPERPASGGRWLPPSQRGAASPSGAATPSPEGLRPSTPGAQQQQQQQQAPAAAGGKWVPPSRRQGAPGAGAGGDRPRW
ncbi:hypothetical protein DMC30DRAFT_421558 [Rhodotorula diobovata]|uniref:Eukaryotic translation initiation factor 3 subunit A n=1 Tax=Rhodotorula diobovata TaxID=5288 RepID=A0A5C5FX07_9BASI|nr:hypothetical protein DMC30DRAFT_421558 [Rhodotorula diobovata]